MNHPPRLDPMLYEMLHQRRTDLEMTRKQVVAAMNGNRWLRKHSRATVSWLASWEKPKRGKCYLGYRRRWCALCEVLGLEMIDILDAAGFISKDEYEHTYRKDTTTIGCRFVSIAEERGKAVA